VEEINSHKIVVVKLEGKKPLWRSRRRCEDSVKMDIKGMSGDGVDWVGPSGGPLRTR
jgi:hypothetical protein